MLFNSLVFAVFLGTLLPLYYCLRHRQQNLLLLAASYFFYGWWDWRFCGLLALSTVVDFFVANYMASTANARWRKVLLWVSICVNLGILGLFKYFDFFVKSAAGMITTFGMNPNELLLEVALPVGISFYTFQTLAYTVSVYRKQVKPTKDFISFAVYVAYFPQLVAGPIERSENLLPQIQKPRRVDEEKITSGLLLMLMGFFKKIAIADAIAPLVDQAFSGMLGEGMRQGPLSIHTTGLMTGIYLFAIQIYCDFSGYTDIARGVSRLMGIELMLNFKQPYFSSNITEFWRRWHISLSSWLRDHLYIPLGGNRHGKARMYCNLMITMLLGGLWHGAGWTFVVWGGLHGLYLAVHKWFTGEKKIGLEPPPSSLAGWLAKLAKMFLTFHLVCLTWIFFRAKNFDQAWDYLLGLAKLDFQFSLFWLLPLFFYGAIVIVLDYLCWSKDRELPVSAETPWVIRGLGYGTAIVLILYVGNSDVTPFIYFQF